MFELSATFVAALAGLNVVIVGAAALAGATGPAIVASTPATAIHSGRRERDFIDLTSEE
jgi:hypothetical protein